VAGGLRPGLPPGIWIQGAAEPDPSDLALVNRQSGFWISGAAEPETVDLAVANQQSGLWISGQAAHIPGAITLNLLTGVWVSSVASRARGGRFTAGGAYAAKMRRWLMKEDEELLVILANLEL
jgi:hypothetical protein